MSIENNEEILSRYIAGECSQDEEIEVEELLESSAGAKSEYEELLKIRNAAQPEIIKQDAEAAWSRFAAAAGIEDDNKSASQTTFVVNRYLRYAAVILIFLLPIFYFSGLFSDPEIKMISLVVEAGDRQSITLNDGTKITLDAGSSLKYPEQFESGRLVELNGEAYFEVAKNPDKPFIVIANQGEVKVLGTKFNIRSWKDINRVQLTVTEGKVSFANTSSKENVVYLTTGQYSSIEGGSYPADPVNVEADRALGWLKNEKYFEDVSLSEVIAQFERWYKIDIRLSDKSALNDNVTINLKNKSYKENLELLSLVTGLNVTYNGNVIVMN